jgi:hypothetical protein
MNAPPNVTIPAPPAGFVPVQAIDLRGYRPLQSVAAQSTSTRTSTSSWSSHVDSQEGMAWKDALEVIESLKPAYALAVTASPSMMSAYPALAHRPQEGEGRDPRERDRGDDYPDQQRRERHHCESGAGKDPRPDGDRPTRAAEHGSPGGATPTPAAHS